MFLETNNMKWGLRKYLEKALKRIYTKATFENDEVASIRVSEDLFCPRYYIIY